MTITTTASNSSQISVGYTVVIAGVAETGYNGTYVVTGKPSSTTFTYTAKTSGLPASGGGTAVSPAGPSYAQTWDGWGPFYGQTYMSFLGVDSSTVEMDDSSASRVPPDSGRRPDDRQESAVPQLLLLGELLADNRQAMMGAQLQMFLDGVNNAPTDPNAFAKSSYLTGLGFTDYSNNWMAQFPKAYVVPLGQPAQRRRGQPHRSVVLDNGIQVQRMTSDFTWSGKPSRRAPTWSP